MYDIDNFKNKIYQKSVDGRITRAKLARIMLMNDYNLDRFAEKHGIERIDGMVGFKKAYVYDIEDAYKLIDLRFYASERTHS